MSPSAQPGARTSGYFASTRAPRYSIVFALPLLVLYEGLASLLGGPRGEIRNAADAIFRGAFAAVAGYRGPAIFMGLVVLTGIALIARDMKRSAEPLRLRYFVGMLAESAVLAVCFGLVIGTLTAQLLGAAHLLAFQKVRGVAANLL